MIQPIETEYKGYKFRSRLEARWAVFFDTIGVEWEYEPEGYELGDGLRYLPNFLLHGVEGRVQGDLYIEVKGQMNDEDAKKIWKFCGYDEKDKELSCIKNRILIVGAIPNAETAEELAYHMDKKGYEDHINWPNYYNFQTIDGDYFVAHLGVNKNGKLELFGDDSDYLCNQDDEATLYAYKKARQSRFEFNK